MRILALSLLCCACARTLPSPAPIAVAPSARAPRPPSAGVPVRVSLVAASSAEPSVGEVVRMALGAARGLSPERIRNLSRRARLSGLAPQLRVSAERGLQQDLSSTREQVDKTNTGDDLSLSASLTFDLDRLVFAPDEVRLLSVERWLAGDQRKLVAEVVKLYFQRRRLLRERALSAVPDGELDDSIAELDALLDSATAGAFSAR